jgi:hypothetical protein
MVREQIKAAPTLTPGSCPAHNHNRNQKLYPRPIFPGSYGHKYGFIVVVTIWQLLNGFANVKYLGSDYSPECFIMESTF